MTISEIETMSGKGAVFIRGFMEAFYGGDESLRQCQEAGLLMVRELDNELSVPYISKLSKTLVRTRVVGRKKIGRHYVVTPSDNTEAFEKFLDTHPFWGTDVGSTEKEFNHRISITNHLKKYHCVRSTPEQRIPSGAYKLLMEKVHSGEYDLAFIPTGVKAGIKFNNKTLPILPLDNDE